MGKVPALYRTWGSILNSIGNLLCFALVTAGGVPKSTCHLDKLCNDKNSKVTMKDFEEMWEKSIKPYIPAAKLQLRPNIGIVAKNFVQKRAFGMFHDGASYIACITEKNKNGGGAPLYRPADEALVPIGWDAQNFLKVQMFYACS